MQAVCAQPQKYHVNKEQTVFLVGQCSSSFAWDGLKISYKESRLWLEIRNWFLRRCHFKRGHKLGKQRTGRFSKEPALCFENCSALPCSAWFSHCIVGVRTYWITEWKFCSRASPRYRGKKKELWQSPFQVLVGILLNREFSKFAHSMKETFGSYWELKMSSLCKNK